MIALSDRANAIPCWFRKTRLDNLMNLSFDKIALMNLSKRILPIALATLLAACASHRIENEPTDNGVQTNKVYLSENPEDQLICRKEKIMGSNLRKRVCYKSATSTRNRRWTRRIIAKCRPELFALPPISSNCSPIKSFHEFRNSCI